MSLYLRGGGPELCSRCRLRPGEITVDDVDLCEECLVKIMEASLAFDAVKHLFVKESRRGRLEDDDQTR